MRTLRSLLADPLAHVTLLTVLIALVLLRSHPHRLDDNFLYQKFIESLAAGKFDLSIPGFQGASFFALPLYLVTRSPLTNIYFQLLCSALLIPAACLAARSLLREALQVILFVYAFALMPFFFFFALRGFTFPSFTLCVLLTLWLRGRGSILAWLPFTISLLIKPFSIALLPLFLTWSPAKKEEGWSRGWVQFLLALIIPILYVAAQYLQVGHIIVGAHEGLSQGNVFQWQRLPLNILHGVQMIFSVHNFYFPDPARTGLGNLTHSSPLLLIFGIVSLLYPSDFWRDRRLAGALLISAILAFLIPASLDHMDHFYLETCVLLLMLASVPFIAKYQLMIPLVLLTFHFQFFYLYLNERGEFFTGYSLFWIPALVDVMAVVCWMVFAVPEFRIRGFLQRWKDQ